MNWLKDNIKILIFDLFDLSILLGCKINSPSLVGAVLSIAIRRSVIISNRKNSDQSVIILDKSFGGDDVAAAFRETQCPHRIYIMQRRYLGTIFNHFFINYLNDINESNYDCFTRANTEKKNYRHFLNLVFNNLKKRIKLRSIISFNIFYFRERELQFAARDLNIKFVVHHKESIHWGQKNKSNIIHWKKYFNFKPISKVSVYNQYTKDLIVEANLVKKENIEVVGMPRTDDYFNLKKYNNKKHVLFLMIEKYASLPYYSNQWYENNFQKFDWNKLSLKVTKIVIDAAKKNKNIKFIFKTKPNESISEIELVKNNNLSNCEIIKGGPSKKLIFNAKLIIAFNTTGIFEALILKKNIVSPRLNIYPKKNYARYSPDLKNLVFEPVNEIQMKNVIDQIIKHKLNIKIDNIKRNKLLIKHFNSLSGNSGKKLKNFLIKNI